MAFADDIASLNEFYFFREFTFSNTTFRPEPAQEVELADNVIWLADTLLVYQLKEREASERTTPGSEARWFEQKVLQKATRQVRDTLGYLVRHSDIELTNHRGHAFNLRFGAIRSLQKLVVYLAHDALPEQCRRIKHHWSRTAGLIHLIPANDYLGIVRILLTPAEVADYLAFREALIDRWEGNVAALPEQALVGQYLCGDLERAPDLAFIEDLQALRHRAEEWDMSGIIKVFAERVTTDNAPTDYYPIVTEIAKLMRNELAEFKKRFVLSMEKARANQFALPYRMVIPRTECGFVFIPLTQDVLAHRRQGLQNMTLAHKYDQRLPRCIGVSFAPEADGWYSVEWCYLEFLWRKEPELENLLRRNNPFRDVKAMYLKRYSFAEQGE